MANSKRVSSILAGEELQKSSDMHEMNARAEVQKNMDSIRTRALEILSLVALSPDFTQLFLVQSLEDMNVFVYTYKSNRTLVLDLLARCPREQVANVETYKFASHPEFEKKITQFTRTAEKPNNQLAKCRSWDVALNLIMKIEALDSVAMQLPEMRMLFREHLIVKHMWEYYMRENMELDEMTGIPIVFRYDELVNPIFNYDAAEYNVYDTHGALVPWRAENRSTLSYMVMEQLGPNVQYLMDVMMAGKKRHGPVFDFDTAFKVFDQLLCRCLQIHRFGVVHNALQPSNLYFGRSITFNVLYVNNFNVAVLLDPKDTTGSRNIAPDSELHGSLRYASHLRMRGAQPHPVHDLESAFYTLIAMLTNNLPWDTFMTGGGTGSRVGAGPMRTSANEFNLNLTSSSSTIGVTEVSKSIEHTSLLQKLREYKSNFWRSPNGIARVLADLQFIAAGADRNRVSLAAEIIKELYSKIRDLLSTIGLEPPTHKFITSLLMQHTNEYQIYTDLRRATLMMYRFESLSAFINTPTYQKKIESLAQEEHGARREDGTVRLAWNLTNWCFSGVEVSAEQDPRTSIVRSATRNLVRTVD